MRAFLVLLFLISFKPGFTQKAYQEFLNIPYLEESEVTVDSLQRLNLLIPKGTERPPLLLWIGGGAWSFVNRNQEMDLCRKLADEGIAVAAVGHRLSKGTFSKKRHDHGIQHPEHIKDVAAAFYWLHLQAEKYGYDKNRIYVGGFSSGAHLSALLGMDPQYLGHHGLALSSIKGLLPISGAFDIEHYYGVFKNHENPENRPLADTHVKDVFGDTEAFKDASPMSYIDHLKLPLLLVSDGALMNYTKHFEEGLKAAAYADFKVYYLEDFDHGGLWRDISGPDQSGLRELMQKFIKTNTL